MGKYFEFKKFDLITPNEKEARFVLADQDSVGKLVGNLIKKLSKNLMLKLGEGVFCKSSNKIQPFSIGSFADKLLIQ